MYMPSGPRRDSWLKTTGTAWDILDAATSMTSQLVECPKCYTSNTVRECFQLTGLFAILMTSPAIATANGQGYVQSKFEYRCTSCKSIINKEGLALLKFTRNLVLDENVPADNDTSGPGTYLA